MESETETSCGDPAPWPGPGTNTTDGGYSLPSFDDEVNWPHLPKRPDVTLFNLVSKPTGSLAVLKTGKLKGHCIGDKTGEHCADSKDETRRGDCNDEKKLKRVNVTRLKSDVDHNLLRRSPGIVGASMSAADWPTVAVKEGADELSSSGTILGGCSLSSSFAVQGGRGDNEIDVPCSVKKRRKKWKRADVTAVTSFKMSLFPRPCLGEEQYKTDLEEICFMECDSVCSKLEAMCSELNILVALDICGKDAVTSHRLRMTRKHKKRKAAKQVKDKHCRSVKNNNRKQLYINHIVYKKLDMEKRGFNFLPSPKQQVVKTEYQLDTASATLVKKPIEKAKFEVDTKTISSDLKRSLDKNTLSSLVELQHRDLTDDDIALLLSLEGGFMQDVFVESMSQTRRQELHELERALLAPPTPSATVPMAQNGTNSSLLDLMTRDLTPEDYDLLLRLDDTVAPKTLETYLVKSLRTVIVMTDSVDSCPICMDGYEVGTVMKYLPCDHAFHERCVDTWLTERSMNCPLDGLPVSCTA
jgi:hypothetical protein